MPTKKTTTRTTARRSTAAQAETATAKTSETLVDSSWQGVTAMICAVLGCFLWWVPVLNVVLGILALIFGILGIKTKQRAMSIISVVVSGIVLVVSFVVMMVYAMLFSFVVVNQDEIEGFARAVKAQLRSQNYNYDYDDYWYDDDWVELDENWQFMPANQMMPMHNQMMNQGGHW